MEGTRVLDLGSGSGRDCYALSKLVGEEGSVVGLDMTDEQVRCPYAILLLVSYDTDDQSFR